MRVGEGCSRFAGIVALQVVFAAWAGYAASAAPLPPSKPDATITDADTLAAPQRDRVAQAPAGGAGASGLPGGASSLNEAHKDWAVACVLQGTAKRCVLSQVQAQQNGQRILAIELNAPNGNSVSGTLAMPFGLALDSGVTLQIDDKPAMPVLRFRTCVPIGCIVNIAFDAPTLATLRTANALKLKATADGGNAMQLSISLQGFASALDRVSALSR